MHTQQNIIQGLVKEYILTSSSNHKERTLRLQQANSVIKKQLSSINNSLVQLQSTQQQYNQQLDEMATSLEVVDIIQENVNRTADNIGKIQQALARLDLENKIEILNKTKRK